MRRELFIGAFTAAVLSRGLSLSWAPMNGLLRAAVRIGDRRVNIVVSELEIAHFLGTPEQFGRAKADELLGSFDDGSVFGTATEGAGQ